MAGGGKKGKPAGSKASEAPVPPSAKGSKTGKKPSKQQAPEEPAAKPAAPKLFDGWTGKTPMTHLNEYVQRQASWHKPSYNVHGNSSNGYTCSVRLSKTDVKNRSAALAVEFRPPGGGPKQRTAVEAKHVAATYALYRMRSDTSLYLSLPPAHRAYWEELKSGREAEWMYAADPFAAKAERDRVREKGEAERARREEKKARAEMGHREELLRPALRRRWDEMAEVRMAEPHRLAVEEVVRSWTRQWDLDRGSAGSGSGSGSGSAAAASASGSGSAPAGLLEELVGLGFCRAHVLEALGAARTRDGAVDWLCVHLPEDDLPQRFLRRLEAPRVVVHDGGVALAARRLRRCGFPQAAVESALGRAAASQQDASDAAAIEACAADLLVAGLCGRRPAPVGPAVAASEDALAEEAEALRMIFFGEDDRVVVNGGRRGSLSVRLRPVGLSDEDARLVADDLSLEVWLPPGINYPDSHLPPMALAGSRVPAFVRLQAALAVNSRVSADGLPVVFDAVRMVEEQLASWIAAPLPLATLMRGIGGLRKADGDGDGGGDGEEQLLLSASEKESSGSAAPRARGSGSRKAHAKSSRCSDGDVQRLSAQFAQLQLDAAYREMQQTRSTLPAYSLRQRILALVRDHRCTLVTGATGCGKTTQVPQFLLDSALADGRHANIVCTQPRRISAIGVAARVSEERAEPALGSGLVGYAVRGDSRRSRDTRLLFCTTGVLLRMLTENPDLHGITHVVCDEVHERSVDSDVLLALLLACLRRNRNAGLRVVLMSATAQSDVFSAYFGGASTTPTVDIPGRAFPVDDVFLEDFVQRVPSVDAVFGAALVGRARARLQTEDARLVADDGSADGDWLGRVGGFERRGCDRLLAACLAQWDDRHGLRDANASSIDVSLAAAAVRHIDATAAKQQSVLVFMPGVVEIQMCVDLLLKSDPDLLVLPLHAGLSPADQRRVFDRPRAGRRKVVVATNIAETSITIDDIGFVVDSGRVREATRDAESGISRLTTRFCSRAAATQRRGRAGRVSKGVCIRLYTRDTLSRAMPEHATPEILRTPLEQVCLQIKALGYGDSAEFLKSMLTPPAGASVELAERLLVAVGACEAAGAELAPLGRLMAEVPVDLRLAKMLVYSAVFGVLDRALVVAALMAHDKPLFAASFEHRDAAREERLRFAVPGCGGDRSDWLADLRAYEYLTGDGRSAAGAAVSGGSLKYVSRAVVRDIKSSVRMLRDSLKPMGLVDDDAKKTSSSSSSSVAVVDDAAVLRAMVFAGLSPNIARVRVPAQKYHEVIGGGAVSIDRQARELMFFAVDSVAAQQQQQQKAPQRGWMDHDFKSDRRVFVHPQSTMFANAKYPVPFVTYFSMTQSASSGGAGYQQRTYMRDVTAPGIYALFMFGPPLVVDAEHNVVCIGPSGGLAVRAWPRVAALVNHLRRLLDELLRRKMADPSMRFTGHPVVEAVLGLIRSDGL